MFTKVFLLAFLAASVSAGSVEFQNCGTDQWAEVTDMRVSGCEGAPPCIIHKGTENLIELDATSKSSSNTLPYKVTALVIVPITIISGDACDSLSAGNCPATPGATFTYQTSINIGAAFPTVNTVVTAEVRNDSGDLVICAKLPVEVRP